MGKTSRWAVLGVALTGFVAGACREGATRQLGEGAGGAGVSTNPSGSGGSAGRGATGATDSPPPPLPAPAASIAPGTMCQGNGWCWYNPLPSGALWASVAGAGQTDLWVGGESPDVLRFDGARWSAVRTPLSSTSGIWAASRDDVWFAGGAPSATNSTIAHWDGTAVTVSLESPVRGGFNAIWGSGPRDIYAVGYETSVHWDGDTWTTIPGVIGTSIAGSGPDDVWVGNYEGMYHFDGVRWTRPPQFLGVFIESISVLGPNDLWALTLAQGGYRAEHFDGSTREVRLEEPANGLLLLGINAVSNQDVWVVGGDYRPQGIGGYLNHFDGSAWTRAPLAPTVMIAARNTPALGSFAVGFDGGLLSLKSAPPGFTDLRTGPADDLLGTFGTAPTDMWAVGARGSALHYDGVNVAAVPSGTGADLTDVWGSGPADVWAVGSRGTALHFDGRSFAPIATGTSADLLAVFTARPNDAWIAGEGATLLHWDGRTVSPVNLPGLAADSPIADIHGLAPDDIWLVAGDFESPLAFAHFDGSAWSVTPYAGAPLRRIWMLAHDDVWANSGVVGSGGVVNFGHFDGTSWTVQVRIRTSPTFVFPNLDRGSFVFGPHDRWIVGSNGLWQRSTQ